MRVYLTPLIQLQRFFLPALVCLALWAAWRTIFKKDAAVGLGLYLGLAVIVDGFMNTGIYLPGMAKGSIRYSEVCALFLLINTPHVSDRKSPWNFVLWPIWLYFGLMFVSAFRNDNLVEGLMNFRGQIVPQIVALLVARRGLATAADYRRFFMALAATVFFVGIWDFWDIIFDRTVLESDVLYKPIYFHNRKLQRFGSIFLNPNYLGGFIALVFPAAFVWALNEQGLRRRVLAWSTLPCMLFCLVETQSRMPLMALGLCVVFLMLGPCGAVSRKRRISLLVAFVLAFAAIMPGFLIRASGRFNTLDKESEGGRSREVTWLYTLRIIGGSPLLGIGFGESMFQKSMREYGFEAEFGPGAEPLDAPHNSYLQAAVYAGIPALLMFLLANAVILFKALSVSIKASSSNTPMVFGLSVGLIGFLASIFPDLQLFTFNVAVVYWVFFGLLLSLVSNAPQVEPALVTTMIKPFAPRTAFPRPAVAREAVVREAAVARRQLAAAPAQGGRAVAIAGRAAPMPRSDDRVVFNVIKLHGETTDRDPRPTPGAAK